MAFTGNYHSLTFMGINSQVSIKYPINYGVHITLDFNTVRIRVKSSVVTNIVSIQDKFGSYTHSD